MKINPNAFNVGKTKASKPIELENVRSKASGAKPDDNTDKISISFRGALKAETDQLTKQVLSEMEQPAAPERLAALKAQVEDGTYHVDTDKLVDALMTRWIGL